MGDARVTAARDEVERVARGLTVDERDALIAAPAGWFNVPEGHALHVHLRRFSGSYRHQWARRRSIALNPFGLALKSHLERQSHVG
jgi:hypothetical protein